MPGSDPTMKARQTHSTHSLRSNVKRSLSSDPEIEVTGFVFSQDLCLPWPHHQPMPDLIASRDSDACLGNLSSSGGSFQDLGTALACGRERERELAGAPLPSPGIEILSSDTSLVCSAKSVTSPLP